MKSKKSIKSILMLSAVVIISLFFINMSLAANTAKVNVETANLRETADESGKILEQLSIGQEIEILEKQSDWYKVKAKGIIGYLRSDLVSVPNEEKNSTQTNNVTDTQIATNNQNEENNLIDTQEKNIQIGEKYKILKDIKLKIVPVINATDIIEVKQDEEVTVTEIINDWICVETTTTKGWLRKENLKTEETKQEEQTAQAEEKDSEETSTKTLYINTETANLRKTASTTSEVVTTLSLNSAVNVISEENGWSKVKVGDKEGYISSSLLSDKRQETSRSMTKFREKEKTDEESNKTENTNTSNVASSGNGSSVVATANQYIGSRYVYGGTTPSGFDCSGFTSYVYKKYGVSLSRTAAGQYSNGVSVSKGELQPGDLVMFGKSGINHVGIYIGGGKMVHAANPSRGVTTDTINSGYYGTNYVGARRILQ